MIDTQLLAVKVTLIFLSFKGADNLWLHGATMDSFQGPIKGSLQEMNRIAWNSKQPFFNGWKLDGEPNHYMKKWCFTKHPFKVGCLGFQVLQMIFGDVYRLHPAPLKGTRACEADRDRGGEEVELWVNHQSLHTILIWVVVWNIFYFHPFLGKIPILTIIFFKGVETTN